MSSETDIFTKLTHFQLSLWNDYGFLATLEPLSLHRNVSRRLQSGKALDIKIPGKESTACWPLGPPKRSCLDAGGCDPVGAIQTPSSVEFISTRQTSLPVQQQLQRSRTSAHARGDAVSSGWGRVSRRKGWEHPLRTYDVKGISTYFWERWLEVQEDSENVKKCHKYYKIHAFNSC